jgi:hypothetical protein
VVGPPKWSGEQNEAALRRQHYCGMGVLRESGNPILRADGVPMMKLELMIVVLTVPAPLSLQ